VFIGATDDARFRTLDAKTGKQIVGIPARVFRQRRADHLSRKERQTVLSDHGPRERR
jgi:hypothetical protein